MTDFLPRTAAKEATARSRIPSVVSFWAAVLGVDLGGPGPHRLAVGLEAFSLVGGVAPKPRFHVHGARGLEPAHHALGHDGIGIAVDAHRLVVAHRVLLHFPDAAALKPAQHLEERVPSFGKSRRPPRPFRGAHERPPGRDPRRPSAGTRPPPARPRPASAGSRCSSSKSTTKVRPSRAAASTFEDTRGVRSGIVNWCPRVWIETWPPAARHGFEGRDLLGDAVLGDGEVLGPQAEDRRALAVVHHDVDGDELGRRPGTWSAARSGSGLRRERGRTKSMNGQGPASSELGSKDCEALFLSCGGRGSAAAVHAGEAPLLTEAEARESLSPLGLRVRVEEEAACPAGHRMLAATMARPRRSRWPRRDRSGRRRGRPGRSRRRPARRPSRRTTRIRGAAARTARRTRARSAPNTSRSRRSTRGRSASLIGRAQGREGTGSGSGRLVSSSRASVPPPTKPSFS